MASSVEQIAARLRHVLDGVGAAERAVQHGLTLIRQAAGSFAQVMRGSAADEPNDVAAQLASAQRTLTETHATLAAITGHIINYLAILGVTTTGHATSIASTPPPPSTKIEELRAQLPPPVVPLSGQKTHGRWIGADGVERSIVSGRDADSVNAWEILKERGVDPKRKLVAIFHAEQKVAGVMVREKITHATLVINHQPCYGDFGCDTLLPVLLPAEYSLTVHGPDNYCKTFTGGRTLP